MTRAPGSDGGESYDANALYNKCGGQGTGKKGRPFLGEF